MRAPEAVAGRLVAWPSLWECLAAQSRQARPEEAQQPNRGPAKAGVRSLQAFGHHTGWGCSCTCWRPHP